MRIYFKSLWNEIKKSKTKEEYEKSSSTLILKRAFHMIAHIFHIFPINFIKLHLSWYSSSMEHGKDIKLLFEVIIKVCVWDVKYTSNGIYVNDMDRFKVIIFRSLKFFSVRRIQVLMIFMGNSESLFGNYRSFFWVQWCYLGPVA